MCHMDLEMKNEKIRENKIFPKMKLQSLINVLTGTCRTFELNQIDYDTKNLFGDPLFAYIGDYNVDSLGWKFYKDREILEIDFKDNKLVILLEVSEEERDERFGP